MEAMALLLHGRPSDWHRTAAGTRHVLGQCADGRLSEGIQHRNGPSRGSSGCCALRVDRWTRTRGSPEIFGIGQKVSESAGAEHHTIRRWLRSEPAFGTMPMRSVDFWPPPEAVCNVSDLDLRPQGIPRGFLR